MTKPPGAGMMTRRDLVAELEAQAAALEAITAAYRLAARDPEGKPAPLTADSARVVGAQVSMVTRAARRLDGGQSDQ